MQCSWKTTGMVIAIVACVMAVSPAKAQEGVSLRSCRPHPSVRAGHSSAAARRMPQRTAATTPYIGDRRQLVILVSFNDLSFKEADPLPLWNNIFNEKHFDEAPFHGSVHDYFYDQSYGQFRLTFDVRHIALDRPHELYKSTRDDDENSKYLVNDLVDVLAGEDIDWSDYDWDGDGYVDQLLIVYAGKGMNAGGDRTTIWPHQYWLSAHEDSDPRTVSRGGQDYIIDCYCCVQELYSRGDYGSFGTICHEYSHCFGFPDFYYGGLSILGQWDLMDNGNNNGGGFCPTGYSAYERMYMGWLTPIEPDGPTSVEGMEALHQTPEAYLLRNEAHPDEYYLLEHRERQGWDEQLPDSGLVVFHVDYDADVWDYDFVNTYQDLRYSIVPANGITQTAYSKGWCYPYETRDALTDTTTPAATLNHANIGGQQLLSKPITDIRHANGVVSFELMADRATAISVATQMRTPETILYRLGRIAIVRGSDGEVRKVVY